MLIHFSSVPETALQFSSMPEYTFTTPFQTAALLMLALNNYVTNPDESYEMIDLLKGPRKMSTMEKQFIRDRMMDQAEYIAKSYFEGASPENNYIPDMPLTISVDEDPYTYAQQGYAKVLVQSAGADSPRAVVLRQKGEQWFLWEFPGILAGIRKPKSLDCWAD